MQAGKGLAGAAAGGDCVVQGAGRVREGEDPLREAAGCREEKGRVSAAARRVAEVSEEDLERSKREADEREKRWGGFCVLQTRC